MPPADPIILNTHSHGDVHCDVGGRDDDDDDDEDDEEEDSS